MPDGMKIVENHYRALHKREEKRITRMIGNPEAAQDIVATAYLRACTYLDSYDPKKAPFIKWFNRILYGCLSDAIRTYKSLSEEEIEEWMLAHDYGEAEDPADLLFSKVKNRKHRKVLYLYYVAGYKTREIPELIPGMTETNVSTILQRFREKVQ